MENNKRLSVKTVYNSILRKDDVFTKLSEFIECAENFIANEHGQDVVKEYIQLSGGCQELKDLLKILESASAKDAGVLLNMFTCILVRIASDLNVHTSLGLSLVTEILNYAQKTLNNFIRVSQKTSRVRCVLHLLASMIAQGPQAAHNVFIKLNIASLSFTHLLSKSNPKEEEDIRASFIKVIMLMLNIGDNNHIRQVVETKSFLNGIFPGLLSDRASVITFVLETFHSKIINNSAIGKTSKVRLFNDYTLKYVMQLYTWSGPLIIQQLPFKRKLGDDGKPRLLDAEKSDITSVKETAHKFLMTLCCSYKNGIIFRDLSCGTSGRNQNHIMTNLLSSFLNPYSNPYASKLVVSVLKTCPDQMKYFLPSLKDSLVPRLSAPWLQAIDLMKKIILSQDCVSLIFKSEEKKSVTKMLDIAKSLCIPPVLNTAQLTDAFKASHHYVCYHVLDYLSCILKQAHLILQYCNSQTEDASSCLPILKEFQNSFISTLKTFLPDVKHVQIFWEQTTNMLSANLEDSDEVKCIVKDFELPSSYEQLDLVLRTLKLYNNIHHDISESTSATYFSLFANLRSCEQHLSKNDACSLQVQLIDLLCDGDFLNTTLWTESVGMSPFSLMLEIFLSASDSNISARISKLIYQTLKRCTLFDGAQWEISVWLSALKFEDQQKHQSLITFVDGVVQSIAHGASNAVSCDVLDFERGNFSILVPAFLYYQHCHPNCEKVCQSYTETCLQHIMHRQIEPKRLLSLVKKYKNLFDQRLYLYWKFLCGTYKKPLKVGDIPVNIRTTGSWVCFQEAFINFHSAGDCSDRALYFNSVKEELQVVRTEEIPWILWQLLKYISFEAESVFAGDDERRTAIPVYVEFLEDLISSTEESVKEDILVENESSKVATFDSDDLTKCLMKDVLSHPSINKYFLEPYLDNDGSNKIIADCVQALANLVFHVLQLKPLLRNTSEFSELLLPFKNKAVSFCKLNVNPLIKEKRLKNYSWSVLQDTVKKLSFMFNSEDTVSFLDQLLTLDKELYELLDPKCAVISLLLETFQQEKKYELLPSQVVRGLFFKFFCQNKKKQKRIMRENLFKLLSKHPVLAFAVDCDIALSLMKQSKSCLKLLNLLIAYNPKIRLSVQAAVVSSLADLEDDSNGFLMHLICQCLKSRCIKEDKTFILSIIDFAWKHIYFSVTEITSELYDSSVDIAYIIRLFLKEGLLDERKIQKINKKLWKDSSQKIPSCSRIPFLIDLICALEGCSSLDSISPNKTLLQLSVNWASLVFQNAQSAELIQYQSLLKVACTFFQNAEISVVKEVLANEDDLLFYAQNLLKVSLRNATVGPDLIHMLAVVCSKLCSAASISDCNSLKDAIKNIYMLVASHSNFCRIMLEDTERNGALKESVIELLVILIQRNKSLCQGAHIPLLLASYTATLSSTDQKLLYLLKLYEDSGIDMSQFSPFLWGNAAVTHYSVRETVKLFLWNRPKMQEILSLFREEWLHCTALNFPLHLNLQPMSEMNCRSNESSIKWHHMYDPRFVLPILSNLLSPGSYVNCKAFIDSKALGVVFAALSSHDSDMRALGYYCLSEFYSHLESSMHGQRKIWISFLDIVRHSIEKPNPRLPCVITVFLIKALNVLTKPNNPLYTSIYKFLTVKPNLDLGQIPEFYKLFNSNEIEHRLQRSWILSLITEGLRGSLDFHICQKRYLFTILLPYYSSSLCAEHEKVKILQILVAVAKIYSSAKTLCQAGLLSWLHDVIRTSDDGVILTNIVEVMVTLWKTSNCKDLDLQQLKSSNESSESILCHDENSERLTLSPESSETLGAKESERSDQSLRMFYSSYPSEFLLVYCSLLKRISSMDTESLHKFLETLNCALKIVFSDKENKDNFNPSLLTCHVIHLCKIWTTINEHSPEDDAWSAFSSSDCISETRDCFHSSTKERKTTLRELFVEVIRYWNPCWNEFICKEQYDAELTVYIDVLFLVFQSSGVCEHHFSDISDWINSSIENDSKGGLIRILLTSETKATYCFEMILYLWEKNLKSSQTGQHHQFVESDESALSKWESIVIKLKTEACRGVASDQRCEILQRLSALVQ